MDTNAPFYFDPLVTIFFTDFMFDPMKMGQGAFWVRDPMEISRCAN